VIESRERMRAAYPEIEAKLAAVETATSARLNNKGD
jgi:hypothetical protein